VGNACNENSPHRSEEKGSREEKTGLFHCRRGPYVMDKYKLLIQLVLYSLIHSFVKFLGLLMQRDLIQESSEGIQVS